MPRGGPWWRVLLCLLGMASGMLHPSMPRSWPDRLSIAVESVLWPGSHSDLGILVPLVLPGGVRIPWRIQGKGSVQELWGARVLEGHCGPRESAVFEVPERAGAMGKLGAAVEDRMTP